MHGGRENIGDVEENCAEGGIMLLQHRRPRGGGNMVKVVVSLVQVVFIPNIAILVGDLVYRSR